MKPLTTILALAAFAATLTGCASSEPATSEPRPVSFDEATLLAGTLAANADAGSASYAFRYQPPVGATFTGEGVVNWANGLGYGTVHPEGTEFLWDTSKIQLFPIGGDPIERPGSPESDPLDYTIGAIMHLASPQPDNPTLVQQNGAQVVAVDDQTTTFLINDQPTAPTLIVDNATGRVQTAIIPLAGGGALTVHLTFEPISLSDPS